ncbi:MAG: hypothetical protein Q4B67_03525 [Eubacteriales bacterium]|nr:hypothetical protein [Eubacteriales bacterium]
MNNLKAGFARVDITPMMGINIAGYFVERIADGVLDTLEANALAVEAGGNKAVLVVIDHCGLDKQYLGKYRDMISEKTGLPREAIMLTVTHTHTGPKLDPGTTDPLQLEYDVFLGHRVVDVAVAALEDLKDCKMGVAVGNAPNIAFIRRYIMKDGSIKTNPGVNNPDIVKSAGDTDERVNVVRFNRGEDDDIVLVNFGCHPDVVGGNKISADWPKFLRQTVEKAIDGSKCLFINGAQGDVNHVNVFPKKGDFNDMFNDFDGVSRGYGHARYMGRVVAGAVLQVFDKVEYMDVDSVKYVENVFEAPSQMPSDIDDITVEEAHRINDLHLAGRDAELPYEAMMLTTMVAQASRIVRYEHGPESFPMLISAFAIGDVAIFGMPGECFTGVGRGLKEAEGWKMVCPVINTNQKEGYFPMKDCYEGGGYEARSSRFKMGTAELIIEKGLELLDSLR